VGAASLVIPGVALLLVAVGGFFPSRLKFGENEIEMLSQMLDEGFDERPTPATKAEFAAELSCQVGPSALAVISETLGSHIIYEQTVRISPSSRQPYWPTVV
jgi:hypothetical protein